MYLLIKAILLVYITVNGFRVRRSYLLTRYFTLIIHYLSRVFFNTSPISKFPPLVTKCRPLGSGITNVITVADYVGFGKHFLSTCATPFMTGKEVDGYKTQS
jgi:hypothetical protein